jgi:hypothetical protein
MEPFGCSSHGGSASGGALPRERAASASARGEGNRCRRPRLAARLGGPNGKQLRSRIDPGSTAESLSGTYEGSTPQRRPDGVRSSRHSGSGQPRIARLGLRVARGSYADRLKPRSWRRMALNKPGSRRIKCRIAGNKCRIGARGCWVRANEAPGRATSRPPSPCERLPSRPGATWPRR